MNRLYWVWKTPWWFSGHGLEASAPEKVSFIRLDTSRCTCSYNLLFAPVTHVTPHPTDLKVSWIGPELERLQGLGPGCADCQVTAGSSVDADLSRQTEQLTTRARQASVFA